MPIHLSHRGRGTVENPPNRFERLSIESDDGAWEEIAATDPDFEPRRVRTEFLRDDSQSILSSNTSPDIGFTHSLNPYRGCEHGCAYCYARPYHEYLGYSSGIDFESRILVKERAPELLEEELAKKSWRPTPLACSGVTDCYQPIERRLEITRRCLAVLVDFRQPVGIITKNALVTRDLDLLAELAAHGAVKDVFAAWLERFEPGRKDLILARIREVRDGRLNDTDYGNRMTGTGPLAEQIAQLLRVSKRRAGLDRPRVPLSTAAFRRKIPGQMELF